MVREFALASLLACAPVAAPQAAAACATRASTTAERNALDEINRFRARNGRAALCYNARIDTAARWLAGDMAAKDYFSHTDSRGRNGGQRLVAFGYAWAGGARTSRRATGPGTPPSWAGRTRRSTGPTC